MVEVPGKGKSQKAKSKIENWFTELQGHIPGKQDRV
jgi:hypothetical protein